MIIALLILVELLGLSVGSFLNVVIYRLPRDLSVVRPPSSCPSCHERISARDNIPILSWVLLRGRCRYCSEPISLRYAFIEDLTANLFLVAAWRIGPHLPLISYLVFITGLVPLCVIDFQFMLLPRRLVYLTYVGMIPGFALDAVLHHSDVHRLVVALGASLSWFLLFGLINLVSPRHLGFGDVRLAGVLGLATGWFGWPVPVVALYTGALLGIAGWALIHWRRGNTNEGESRLTIPFGPYLALGALVAIVIHPTITTFFAQHHL